MLSKQTKILFLKEQICNHETLEKQTENCCQNILKPRLWIVDIVGSCKNLQYCSLSVLNECKLVDIEILTSLSQKCQHVQYI